MINELQFTMDSLRCACFDHEYVCATIMSFAVETCLVLQKESDLFLIASISNQFKLQIPGLQIIFKIPDYDHSSIMINLEYMPFLQNIDIFTTSLEGRFKIAVSVYFYFKFFSQNIK